MIAPEDPAAPCRLNHDLAANIGITKSRSQGERGIRGLVAARHHRYPAAGSQVGHRVTVRKFPDLIALSVKDQPAARRAAESKLSLEPGLALKPADPGWTRQAQDRFSLLKACRRLRRLLA